MKTPAISEEQRSHKEIEVRAAIDEVLDAARHVDVAEMMRHTSNVHNLGTVDNGIFYPIWEDFLGGFDNFEREEINVAETRVAVLAPDVAVATIQGDFSAFLKDGSTFRSRYVNSLVLVKQGDAWKMIHGHQSFPQPEAK